MGFLYSQLDPQLRAKVDSADAKEQGKPDPHAPVKFENEAQFQQAAEKWLESRGYRRRTPREIQRHHAGLWYVHIVEAKKNPILCDLVLIDSNWGAYDCRCVEIELKVGAPLSIEQRCLVIREEVVLVYNMDEFEAAFWMWRKSVNERRGE